MLNVECEMLNGAMHAGLCSHSAFIIPNSVFTYITSASSYTRARAMVRCGRRS
jgi:hypothetical protein